MLFWNKTKYYCPMSSLVVDRPQHLVKMDFHPQFKAFSVLLTIFIIASQSTETAAKGKEKISNLQFFFHDKVSGPNLTAVEVAHAPSTKFSPTFFGSVVVIDDMLTEGPEPTSKLVGRAQGLYTLASKEDVQLLIAVTYVFQSGEFNGSTLSVVGHNAVFNKVREMPIVGGSGKFRLARGYALAHTHSFDLHSGNAIVHYNVTVLHYY